MLIRGWRQRLWGVQTLAKHGRADTILYIEAGLGDQLFLTVVARELCRRKKCRVWVFTKARALFELNPDVKNVIAHGPGRAKWFAARFGGKAIEPWYGRHIEGERRSHVPDLHVLAGMCKSVGITGPVTLRPYLHLNESEKKPGRLFDRQIAIQSTGRSAAYFMRTKEWFPERFQEVVAALKGEFNFVQVGSKEDPKLEGAHDLRGKTSIRETAAVIHGSILFVGLVGFLMHLTRAVERRAVIVYGGRELPSQSGYPCNVNLTGQTACSPCWRYDDCPGQFACMDQITAAHVIKAVTEASPRGAEPLETQVLEL